jgi:FkbM family methyltransferase
MKTYSQSQEDLFVLNYFGDYKGTLLDIGANDGNTFSNSKLLIENEWEASLYEPGKTYNQLYNLHKNNGKVRCYNVGIGSDEVTIVDFWESGAHIQNGTDRGLVSTTNFEETKRWPNVKFVKKSIELVPFDWVINDGEKFDFISIDAEGYDWNILQQIDLDAVGCKVLCIEWNSDQELMKKFVKYCKGYRPEVINGENIIFCKI